MLPDALQSVIDKTRSFGLRRYPIGFWNYTSLAEHGAHLGEEAVQDWADAGFTVPQSPNFDASDPAQRIHMTKMLDWCGQRGMKLILCDKRTYAPHGSAGADPLSAGFVEGVKAAVKTFGHHPALFGFHVGDEPGKERSAAFVATYRLQKQLAPHLHPFANLLPYWGGAEEIVGAESWPAYLDDYARKSDPDLISYDYYGQMNPGQNGWLGYFENLRLYRDASLRNGVPFWNTILSVGHFRYRCPNVDEIRWQFNTTLASGANGILWFFYYMRQPHDNYRLAPVDEHWDKTETYWNVRRWQLNFHKHYGNLFSGLVSTRVTFFGKVYGGGQEWTPNGLVSKIEPDAAGHPLLVGEFADEAGQRYVMVVNNSMTDSVNVRVTFPGEKVKVYSWDWAGQEKEGRAYCCSGATARDKDGLTGGHWLAPGQEFVYRVESPQAANEPLMAE